ncbi:protein COFACTOR ASSEMBLY OF COMPLEX C SUBUNIT B CCB2, chloroplastic isoform X1 [Musa acuminata AAA Group]|uniref:protein COFACTOR ASSEMBLY OF COMPLEX C SUBUNIT B CCB2, chloroplastic isoform X1 n=1 Tax=Musa acuminata AAA Group TaxID=214697 RepID=UPI0031DBE041
MASGCAVSVAGGSKWLLQFKNQDAREGLAISRLPPLRPSTGLPPSLLLRLARTPDRCRLFTVAAQDSNPRQQQQQELDVSVLRFTFGIPGLDESYLPRYIGIAFGFLIILNHVFSASPATPAQLRTEALGMCLAAFSTALPYLGRFLEGANATDRASIPEENKQIFFMSNDILDTQKGDLAWASYALLRNTNSMSVIIAVNDVICVRGYWNTPEDKDASKDHLLNWFNSQIQKTGFFDLKDMLYFPQCSATESELGTLLPKGTLSALIQPVIRTSDPVVNFAMKNEGFILLASSVKYAYSEKDRAWIRAVANKFLHKISKDL